MAGVSTPGTGLVPATLVREDGTITVRLDFLFRFSSLSSGDE
jgi:hypothetical protein